MTKKLCDAGIAERVEVYPGHKFRARPEPEDSELLADLKRADEAFG